MQRQAAILQQQAAEAQRQAAELPQLYHQIEQQRIAKELELARQRPLKSYPVAELLLHLSSLFRTPHRLARDSYSGLNSYLDRLNDFDRG